MITSASNNWIMPAKLNDRKHSLEFVPRIGIRLVNAEGTIGQSKRNAFYNMLDSGTWSAANFRAVIGK